MSKLATSLAEVEVVPTAPKRRAACFPLYGEGDREDQKAIYDLQEQKVTWEQIQVTVDDLLGIPQDQRLDNRKFIRHWRNECSCWDKRR